MKYCSPVPLWAEWRRRRLRGISEVKENEEGTTIWEGTMEGFLYKMNKYESRSVKEAWMEKGWEIASMYSGTGKLEWGMRWTTLQRGLFFFFGKNSFTKRDCTGAFMWNSALRRMLCVWSFCEVTDEESQLSTKKVVWEGLICGHLNKEKVLGQVVMGTL